MYMPSTVTIYGAFMKALFLYLFIFNDCLIPFAKQGELCKVFIFTILFDSIKSLLIITSFFYCAEVIFYQISLLGAFLAF